MSSVHHRAEGLLVEVVRLVEADAAMDKLQPLKNATPAHTRGQVEDTFAALSTLAYDHEYLIFFCVALNHL